MMLAVCFYTQSVELFFNHERMSNFVNCFFCFCWGNHMIFIFHSINVVYHMYWFAYIEPCLHPRDKSHLIMRFVWSFKCAVEIGFLIFYWEFFFNKFIYFWLCWVFVAACSLVAASGGHSSFAVRGLLIVVASLVAEHGLQAHGLQ